ncbi:MAG: tryptophan--tRNA ligase, partial [Gammaproteobacteria bacterium]
SGKEISYFKSELKDVVINLIEPISSRIQDIKNDKTLLINTLKLGSDKAREIATKTISDVDNLMGLNIE